MDDYEMDHDHEDGAKPTVATEPSYELDPDMVQDGDAPAAAPAPAPAPVPPKSPAAAAKAPAPAPARQVKSATSTPKKAAAGSKADADASPRPAVQTPARGNNGQPSSPTRRATSPRTFTATATTTGSVSPIKGGEPPLRPHIPHDAPLRSAAANATPGPGSYEVSPRRGGPVITMSPRLDNTHPKHVAPGPGEYDVSPRRAGPAFSMAARVSMHAPANNPGPGAYYQEARPASPSITLAAKWPLPNKSAQLPGPGAYSLPGAIGHQPASSKPTAPAYTLSPRRDMHGAGDTPGPGNYVVPSAIGRQPLSTKPSAPASSMADRPVTALDKLGAPGPGAYNPAKRAHSPTTKFGTASRFAPVVVAHAKPSSPRAQGTA